jgi:hypothetical protein
MAFDYSLPPPVPVAVAVAADNQSYGGDGGIPVATATATRPSLTRCDRNGRNIYRLPSSRRNDEFAAVPERRIQQLVEQGYTRGHAASLARTIRNFPLRIWVVDNSGSMQQTDGHRLVETTTSSRGDDNNNDKRDLKVVGCSRWNELKDCIEYHAQMAAALEAPTTFRMLNDPRGGRNSEQFGTAKESLDEAVLQQQINRAIAIMKSTQPGGVTPLIRHIEEIRHDVVDLAPILLEDGNVPTVITVKTTQRIVSVPIALKQCMSLVMHLVDMVASPTSRMHLVDMVASPTSKIKRVVVAIVVLFLHVTIIINSRRICAVVMAKKP